MHYAKKVLCIFAPVNTIYMRSKILLLFILTCCYACASKSQTGKPTEPAADPVVSFADDDAEMNEAIKKAKSSFTVFAEAFKSNKKNLSYFSIKIPFSTPDGDEHIWLSDISKEKDVFFGIIDNVPESATNVKIGDKIKIEQGKISDWMFIERTKLRGGYTLRVILKRMTDEERKEFLAGAPFTVDDKVE